MLDREVSMAGSNTPRGGAQRDLRFALQHIEDAAAFLDRAMGRDVPHDDTERSVAGGVLIALQMAADALYGLRDLITPNKELESGRAARSEVLRYLPLQYECQSAGVEGLSLRALVGVPVQIRRVPDDGEGHWEIREDHNNGYRLP